MFNPIDRISLDELTPELREIILQSDANYDDIVLSLQSHIKDTTAHVTSEERTYWNNKAPIDSPYFIGTPKAPTPEQGSNSDMIATTKFVTLYIESLDIQNSTTAEKLKTPIAISLVGKAKSETLVTDLSEDVAINVTQIDATALTGTISRTNLAGEYDISITGTAQNANTVGNMNPNDFAKINSPVFTGTPSAPTPGVTDNSTRIATTQFVNNMLDQIIGEDGASVASANKLTIPRDVFVTGVVSGQSIAPFDGSDNLTINITDVEGTLTTEQITKLDGIDTNANYYIHPENHPASMITGLANVATSGSYIDLSNKPDLSQYITTTSLNQVLQNYTTDQELTDSLANYVTTTNLTSTLENYVTDSELSTTLNDYVTSDSLSTTLNDYVLADTFTDTLADYSTTQQINTTLQNYVTNKNLTNTLQNYVTSADLADGEITINLDYNDLQNKPDLSVYATIASLANVATSGSYNDLSDTPDLSNYVTIDQIGDGTASAIDTTGKILKDIGTRGGGFSISTNSDEGRSTIDPAKIVVAEHFGGINTTITPTKIVITGDVDAVVTPEDIMATLSSDTTIKNSINVASGLLHASEGNVSTNGALVITNSDASVKWKFSINESGELCITYGDETSPKYKFSSTDGFTEQ